MDKEERPKRGRTVEGEALKCKDKEQRGRMSKEKRR